MLKQKGTRKHQCGDIGEGHIWSRGCARSCTRMDQEGEDDQRLGELVGLKGGGEGSFC